MIDTITYALLKKHVEEKIAELGTVLRYAGAVDTIPSDLSDYQPGDVIINIDNGIEYVIYIKDNEKVIEELGDGFGIATLTFDLSNHKTDTSNPHSVTAAQTGAYTTAQTNNLLNNKLDTTGGSINGNLQINGKETIQQTREVDANEALITDANTPIEANYYSKWNSGSTVPVTMINTETERGYITAPVDTNKQYLVVGKFKINGFSQNSVKLGALGRTNNSSEFYFSNYIENIIPSISTNQTYTICYCVNSGNKTGMGFGFINTITGSNINITLTDFKVYPLTSVPSLKIQNANQLLLNRFIRTENLFNNNKTNCVFVDSINEISYIYGITGAGATFTYLSDVEIKIEEGQIKGIVDPTNNNDVATKKYVDESIGNIPINDISLETGLGEKSIKMKTIDFENVLATIIPAMEAYLQINPDVYQALVAQGFGNTIPEVARNYVLYIFQTDFNITPLDDFHNEATEGASIALGAGSRAYAPIGIAAGLRAVSGVQYDTANNVGAISVGIDTTAKGVASVAVGNGVEADGRGAIVLGSKKTTNLQEFIDGGWDVDGHCTKWFEALVTAGVIEDKFDDVDFGKAIGDYALALSRGLALEDGSIAAGIYAVASAENAQAFGNQTLASGVNAHAEGISTVASGQAAHSEGAATYATGDNAHAEGGYTEASGMRAHAEGGATEATAVSAHAEGYRTQATSDCAHAEGIRTVASGGYSHAEGMDTVASGGYSHAGGAYTKATANAQTAIGKYNVEDNDALFIVGNGTANNNRSNAFTVKSNGDVVISGKMSGVSNPVLSTDATNKQYVDNGLSGKASINTMAGYQKTMVDVRANAADYFTSEVVSEWGSFNYNNSTYVFSGEGATATFHVQGQQFELTLFDTDQGYSFVTYNGQTTFFNEASGGRISLSGIGETDIVLQLAMANGIELQSFALPVGQSVYTNGLMTGQYVEKVDNIEEDLSLKADKSTTYTKTEINTSLNNKLNKTQYAAYNDEMADVRDSASTYFVTDIMSEFGNITYDSLTYTFNGDQATVTFNIQGQKFELTLLDTNYNQSMGLGYSFVTYNGQTTYFNETQDGHIVLSGVAETNIILTISVSDIKIETFKLSTGQKIYTDGVMHGTAVEKIDNLENQIGDIDTALQAIIALQQSYIGE